jgi:DNA-3-methyladenine glycosylase II
MVLVRHSGPYDLALSLKAGAAFSPEPSPADTVLRVPGMAGQNPAIVKIQQIEKEPAVLQVSSAQPVDDAFLRETAEWVTLADLDLSPFYALCEGNSRLGPLTRLLRGVKHLRPVSIFEMAVIAVIEQQISLVAAYRIRERLVRRFGREIEDLWIFPDPESLARPEIAELKSCGLSSRKAEYVRDLARSIDGGSLDLDSIEKMDDDEARAFIAARRGFGRWSADYILIRGLGRTDAVPTDDLAVRTVAGRALGEGTRMTPAEVERALEPFRPYRGLAVFYLLASARLTEREAKKGKG